MDGQGWHGLVVPAEAKGMRVDAFVAWALRGPSAPSRSEAQRWIALGNVTRDGRALRGADRVHEGDRLRVLPAPPATTDVVPEEGVEFEVLHVDATVVVVNKPAGLVVHPARGHAAGTLVHGLLARGLFAADEAPSLFGRADDPPGHVRPGIVHRLDRGTSGVLVVARTAEARERLKAQFAAHTIDREYEALACGGVRLLLHDTLHGRHPKDRLRFSGRVRAGKRAVTRVEVVRRFGDLATHVRCRLETGRTHQIRVHLAESGTPILGDVLYGGTPRDPALRAIGESLGHQALHARLLGFVHPLTGERVRFEAAPPVDFVESLAALARMEGGSG